MTTREPISALPPDARLSDLEIAYAPPWDGPDPTLFLDSVVMNEIFTIYDIARAIEDHRRTPGFSQNPEDRRLRARGTLWLVMALDDEQRATLCLGKEALSFLYRRTPPRSHGARWVHLWSEFLRPFVCPGWKAGSINDEVGHGGAADTRIADEAAQRGIAVVTRDDGVFRKGQARGVRVVTPEEHASARIPLSTARDRFFERFEAHAIQAAAQFALKKPDWHNAMERYCRGLGEARDVLSYLWADNVRGRSIPSWIAT